MKTEYRLFGAVMLTLFVFAGVYGWWTWYDAGEIEWIGFIALLLSALLCTMCWGYFWMVARRIDLRPEDRADAEIADAAGEVGFFSPGSYWPFGVAAAATLTGLGVVYWMPWLIAAGVVSVLAATGGLLFEYYSGTRKLGPE